jgi:hypothetical protein
MLEGRCHRDDSRLRKASCGGNAAPLADPKHLSTAIDADTRADLRDLLAVASLFRLDPAVALDIVNLKVSVDGTRTTLASGRRRHLISAG